MGDELIVLRPKLESKIDRILYLCDCPAGSGGYDVMLKETKEVVSELSKIAEPVVSLRFCKDAIYCVMTIGQKASELSGSYFDHGDCVKGLIADNACDDLVFSIGEYLKPILKRECQNRNIGISQRLEAPKDIPMDEQIEICQLAGADKIGVTVLKSLMLFPVKSTCCKYIISNKCEDFNADHDCSKCPRLDCKIRNRNNGD